MNPNATQPQEPDDLAQTRPVTTQPADSISDVSDNGEKKSRRRWPWYILIYIAVVLLVSGAAYLRGKTLRNAVNEDRLAQYLEEQFNLGMENLSAGQYETARQRFEEILYHDPSYPQIEEKLIEVYVVLGKPTPAPTARPTSTPDPSPPDELFLQAQEALAIEDWTTVIEKLLSLRSKDPTYKAVEADGMMFLALRNRGMEQIALGLMEEGLYDLSLAERFGPLDRDAMFRKTLAEQYLLANSFIGLDWFQAASLFASLCEQGATIDSCPKYAEAAWEYGDLLWIAEDPCGAQEYYQGSLNAVPNSTLEPTATEAAEACQKATAPPPAPPTATPTLEGTVEEPPPEETPTPTEE
jgi:tetratricopeptide (TPR) repeat protein